MRPIFVPLLILLPIMFSRAAAQPSSDRAGAIQWQGVERHYVLHRSSGNAGSEPLVIALHGFGQDIESLRHWLAMDAVADQNGFTVVYPEAIGLKWSYWQGGGVVLPNSRDEEVDDVGFIAAVVDTLVKDGVVNPDRVYLTGISRGALMSWTLVCERADLFRAIAPLSSAMTAWHQSHCNPSRLVPVIAVDGTSDPVQAYDGFLFTSRSPPVPRLLSVPETMSFWWQLHGCTGERIAALPHAKGADPTQIMLYEWTGCARGGGVTLYRVNNGGHMPPSLSDEDYDKKQFGLRNHDVETAALIWKAFSATP